LGGLYVYAPLKVRRSQIVETEVKFHPIELGNLPPQLAQAICDATPQLASHEFQPIGHVMREKTSLGQLGFVSVWTNLIFRDVAQVIGVLSPGQGALKGALKAVTITVFRTEFTNGSVLVTSNWPKASAHPTDPDEDGVRCPGVLDMELLYRFHRARVEERRGNRTPSLEMVANAVERLQYEHRRTYRRLVAAKYYELDSAGKRYVPTLRGAFLMTYRLLPPFKQIQLFMRRRKADRELRRLGFGGLGQFTALQSLQEQHAIGKVVA
jgi:hypothetical protein